LQLFFTKINTLTKYNCKQPLPGSSARSGNRCHYGWGWQINCSKEQLKTFLENFGKMAEKSNTL